MLEEFQLEHILWDDFYEHLNGVFTTAMIPALLSLIYEIIS